MLVTLFSRPIQKKEPTSGLISTLNIWLVLGIIRNINNSNLRQQRKTNCERVHARKKLSIISWGGKAQTRKIIYEFLFEKKKLFRFTWLKEGFSYWPKIFSVWSRFLVYQIPNTEKQEEKGFPSKQTKPEFQYFK